MHYEVQKDYLNGIGCDDPMIGYFEQNNNVFNIDSCQVHDRIFVCPLLELEIIAARKIAALTIFATDAGLMACAVKYWLTCMHTFTPHGIYLYILFM